MALATKVYEQAAQANEQTNEQPNEDKKDDNVVDAEFEEK